MYRERKDPHALFSRPAFPLSKRERERRSLRSSECRLLVAAHLLDRNLCCEPLVLSLIHPCTSLIPFDPCVSFEYMYIMCVQSDPHFRGFCPLFFWESLFDRWLRSVLQSSGSFSGLLC